MTEESLFDRAMNVPAAELAAFTDRECAGDAELRRRVEARNGLPVRVDAACRRP